MRLATALLLSLAVLAPTPLLAQSGGELYCTAKLKGKTPGSQVNLRSGPGTNYQQKGYGLVGDFVEVLPNTNSESRVFLVASDSQGSLWFGIRFPESGAQGWVHQDFISPVECDY